MNRYKPEVSDRVSSFTQGITVDSALRTALIVVARAEIGVRERSGRNDGERVAALLICATRDLEKAMNGAQHMLVGVLGSWVCPNPIHHGHHHYFRLLDN